MKRGRRQAKAFTLAEVLMASAILAFAVAAIGYAISAGQAQTYNALHELRALSLAETMMEEIIATPYIDPQGGDATPGPDEGEAGRADFDNIDDYHGYNEAIGTVADAQGLAYGGAFAAYARSVTVVYGNVSFADLGDAIAGVTVTVTVTDAKGRAWQAVRFLPETTE